MLDSALKLSDPNKMEQFKTFWEVSDNHWYIASMHNSKNTETRSVIVSAHICQTYDES